MGNAPVPLIPIPCSGVLLLRIVEKVDNPTSTVFPLTPIEIGELDLENPDILPQEKFPTIDPEVVSPTSEVVDNMLQVIIPIFSEIEEYALIL